jgi:uncharacterized membrane protein
MSAQSHGNGLQSNNTNSLENNQANKDQLLIQKAQKWRMMQNKKYQIKQKTFQNVGFLFFLLLLAWMLLISICCLAGPYSRP